MRNSGFTLIELLVVIGIIGILSGMSVAQYKSVILRARIAKAVAFESQVDRQLLAEMTSQQLKMVAKYDFEEIDGAKFLDQSGNKLHLNAGSGQQISVDVPYGSGNSFYSVKKYSASAPLGKPGQLPLGELTASYWIKFESGNDDNCYGVLAGNPDYGVELSTRNGGFFRLEPETGGSNDLSVIGDSDIRDGNWHHFMGVYTGSKQQIYIDGNFVSEQNLSSNLATTFSKVGVGYITCNQFIDNVRIYPVAYKP